MRLVLGLSKKNILSVMRRRLFPFSHNPYPWCTGREETATEVMRSLLAIYLYRFEIARLSMLPVDPPNFTKYLYQPERDNETSELVHHREDHNHILKRITTCLREGVIPGLNTQFIRYNSQNLQNRAVALCLHNNTIQFTYSFIYSFFYAL